VKKLLIIMALAAAALSTALFGASDTQSIINGVTVTRRSAPCTLESVPAQLRPLFSSGRLELSGSGAVEMCWSLRTDPGNVCIVDENGWHIDVPLKSFGTGT